MQDFALFVPVRPTDAYPKPRHGLTRGIRASPGGCAHVGMPGSRIIATALRCPVSTQHAWLGAELAHPDDTPVNC
jgi:hypothetical protein